MFKRLKYFIKRKPKTTLFSGIAVALVAVAIPVVVHAGFGPSRPTFDWNKYNPNASCTDPSNTFGRCGSMNGPVFDSFLNTPSYGDEENFTQIAPVVAGQSPVNASYTGTTNAVAGQQYWVRMLVHNDANQNLNCLPQHDSQSLNDCTQIDPGSPSIATGTNVRVAIANGTANGVDVMGYISAANSNPGTIWDSSTLQNQNQAFSVSYVNGSAVIYNGAHQNGLPLSDNIASANGTPIGFNQMDGVVPGCFNFSSYVFVKVNVSSPALKIQKTVRVGSVNGTPWNSGVSANTGDTLQWKITYQNTGTAVDNAITLRDPLPSGLTLVPGSIKWFDANNNGTVQGDTSLGSGGLDVGNYAPSATDINGEIEFETTINKNPTTCTITNTGFVRAQNIPEMSSNASVTINNCKTPPPPPPPPPTPTPKFTCDELDTTQSGQSVTISKFKESASGGAVFNDAVIDWGDNSQALTTNNVVGQTHTFTGTGPFKITAVANFTVNAKTVNPDKNNCVATVSFTKPPTSPASTPTPPSTPVSQLVNTGPGAVVGIFISASLVGAVIHRMFLGKWLAKNKQ